MFGTIAIVILTAAVGIFVGREIFYWLIKEDKVIVERRRHAFQLAATLRVIGLKRIPDFLGDYAVGDYLGMYEKIHDLAKLALTGGDAAVMSEFETVFQNMLTVKAGTDAGRSALLAKLGVMPAAPAPEPAPMTNPAAAPVK